MRRRRIARNAGALPQAKAGAAGKGTRGSQGMVRVWRGFGNGIFVARGRGFLLPIAGKGSRRRAMLWALLAHLAYPVTVASCRGLRVEIMAKKKKSGSESDVVQLDMSKGFGNGAFSGLKALQDMRRSEQEDAREEAARREAEARARRERHQAEIRDLHFTEADLHDTEGLSDAEIFAASMRELEKGVDVYQSKFNVKEAPRAPRKEAEEHLTMSDSEREFALFTQEMAISNVKRMTPKAEPVHKVRNKGKWRAADLEKCDPVTVEPAPQVQEPGMRTDFVAPQVAVTQVEKGDDILEHPDLDESMTASQKQLLHDVRRYEARYGILPTLRLRGMPLHAALARLDEFIAASVSDRRPYALVICGKGLGSAGEPVIKNNAVDILRSDRRIIEYVPVINADGDFGSIYVSFRRN